MVGSIEVSERLHRTSLPHALAVTFADDKQWLPAPKHLDATLVTWGGDLEFQRD